MIRYDLVCAHGHRFEGWFRDSAAYEVQERHGLLTCATCGSSKVERAIMAPAVARRDRERAVPAAMAPPAEHMARRSPWR